MRKRLVVLAWHDCIPASWLFAGKQGQKGPDALASADQMPERARPAATPLSSGARSWRPITV